MPATTRSSGKKHGFGRDSWPLGRKDFRSDSIKRAPLGLVRLRLYARVFR